MDSELTEAVWQTVNYKEGSWADSRPMHVAAAQVGDERERGSRADERWIDSERVG